MTLRKLSPEWLSWVDENIALGAVQQTLVDTLVRNEFEPELAVRTVRSRAQLVASIAPPAAKHPDPVEKHQYHHESSGPLAGNVLKIGNQLIPVLMRYEKPRVVLFGNVLTKQECEQLIDQSRSKLARSTTVDDSTGEAEFHESRTSAGTFFQLQETPLIAEIDRRVATLMQMPVANGEGLQILNYKAGGEYKPHFDYFPPQLPGSAAHIKRGGQRVATLIMYLNTVQGGGETIFPMINLKVMPIQGCAIYFSYANSRNQVDPLTYHGGCPVTKGEKWIATKWMRQREYR